MEKKWQEGSKSPPREIKEKEIEQNNDNDSIVKASILAAKTKSINNQSATDISVDAKAQD